MDGVFHDGKKGYFKNNIFFKIMQKMGFKGMGLGSYGQGMKGLIQPIWRPKFEGLGFDKRERFDVSCSRSNVTSTTGSNKSHLSKECISSSHCRRDGHTKDKCWDLFPCTFVG